MNSTRRMVIMAIVIGLTIAVAALELMTTHKTISNGLRGSQAEQDRESLKHQLEIQRSIEEALRLKVGDANAQLVAVEKENDTLLDEIDELEDDAQVVINELEEEIEEDAESLDAKEQLLEEVEGVVEQDEQAIAELEDENTELTQELDNVEEEFEAAEESVVEVCFWWFCSVWLGQQLS